MPSDKARSQQPLLVSAGTKSIGVTVGDPGGIGPEVLVRALSVWEPEADIVLRVYGDRQQLYHVAKQYQLPDLWQMKHVTCVEHVETAGCCFPSGTLSDMGAKAQVGYLQMAMADASVGHIAALVTGPIHKQALARCGLPYHGHTDWLEAHFGVTRAVMMLAGPRLRTVPCTIHIPLRDVPNRISRELLEETLVIVDQGMRKYMGMEAPRLAVCGLNPHASDGGMFGNEEANVIAPAIAAAQAQGILASGPYPGDTVCYFAAQGQFDVVVGMYHDQVLAPLKLLHFEDAVNLTLGLPLLRTSVDHGTAYDIAGTGRASSTSMEQALIMAHAAVRKG